MSILSVQLSRTIERGRSARVLPTRSEVLATLLRKRAAAHQCGAEDIEALLRSQIRWSLPVHEARD